MYGVDDEIDFFRPWSPRADHSGLKLEEAIWLGIDCSQNIWMASCCSLDWRSLASASTHNEVPYAAGFSSSELNIEGRLYSRVLIIRRRFAAEFAVSVTLESFGESLNWGMARISCRADLMTSTLKITVRK